MFFKYDKVQLKETKKEEKTKSNKNLNKILGKNDLYKIVNSSKQLKK